MKQRILFRFMSLSSYILVFMALLTPLAMADDETEATKVEVQAPLDAVNCTATPPTINVLGLTIDISHAGINMNDDEDDSSHQSDHPDGTCADLVPGQVVEVKFVSDTPDPITGLLSAVEVDIGGGDCEDKVCDSVKVEAPLQAIDPSGNTVTVLGLVVDISQAQLQGDHDEDDDNDGENPPVDISQLIPGQFVELTLASAQPPLVATKLEVKNFDNEIDVNVEDEHGDVDDGDDDDVEIDVTVTVLVKAKQGVGKAKAAKAVKKVVTLHTVSNGRATLKGLPTGKAKIVVTRIRDGRKSVGKATVKVESKGTKQVRVRLKPVR